jgi:SAM-dependent methyltransferase
MGSAGGFPGVRRGYWDDAYAHKGDRGVSWFEKTPAVSLELIAALPGPKGSLIDVGGGASRLAACALDLGFGHVAVLDVSAEAVARATAALGVDAGRVEWIIADVTDWMPDRQYDIWHDRAAFHFLTDERDQSVYVSTLRAALAPNGYAIIATFAPDGPDRCSGLPVQRYDAESLAEKLGSSFKLVRSLRHRHHTPWGSAQAFQFSVFSKAP